MKNVLKSKFLWASTLMLTLGIAGCNIFNPTESVNIKNDDAEALTYEGYLKFRNNEYTEAEEYFNKAIAADSNYSQAWLGLMKSVLNRKLNSDKETNVFSLLKYVNASRDSKVPFSGMDDNLANKLDEVVDTVNYIVDQFSTREKSGNTDSVVTSSTISDGYMVLQMMKTMLVLRKATSKMDGCSLSKGQENSCDMKTILNSMKDEPGETVEAFHTVFESCEENPSSMINLFGSYLQGYDMMDDDIKNTSVKSMCGALSKETDATGKSEDEQVKTMNIMIGQFGYSDTFDDDGDGCIDEEIYDGEDNDGDGDIDEDIRDKTNPIHYDQERITKNVLAAQKQKRDPETKELLIVKDAGPNEKYGSVDIDMNGEVGSEDTNEWQFINETYDQRVAAQYFSQVKAEECLIDEFSECQKNDNCKQFNKCIETGDHRFKFANNLKWNPTGLSPEEFKSLKSRVAKDLDPNNLQFDLEARKNLIGGCWTNYSERDFKNWFNREIQ